jgi:hypothetical protein
MCGLATAACEGRPREAMAPPETHIEPVQVEEPEPVRGRRGLQIAGGYVLDVSDVTGYTSAYIGRPVTVQGEMQRIYAARGFRLNHEAPVCSGIDGDLIVVGTQNVRWSINDDWANDHVEVEGTIRPTGGRDMQDELGWDFDSQFQEALDAEPIVLVASDVRRPAAATLMMELPTQFLEARLPRCKR